MIRNVLPVACPPAGLLAALLALGAVVGGSDWPQWRGPNRDGVSTETDWVAVGAEQDLWRTSVGLGYSTVSIQAGRLYTLGHDPEAGLDTAFCLDAESGEVIWEHSWPARIWNEMHAGGTVNTPSVDGELLYVLNREGRFLCLRSADGELVWEKQLAEEFEAKPPRWGFSAAPLVLEDKLVLNLGRVFAVDKRTGEDLWASQRHFGDAYSTPVDFELGGKRCLGVFNSQGLAVLDLSDGSERFFHEWKTQYNVQCATPVVVGEQLFISSGQNRGAALLAFDGDAPRVVWESKVMRTRLSGCVLWEDHLYGFDDTQLKCIGLDGQEKWRKRGLGDGCLIAAGGRLLCMSSEGELVVVEATPQAYRELSRTKVLDGGVFWTTPVLHAGRIYCRSSQGDLVCRDHREKE